MDDGQLRKLLLVALSSDQAGEAYAAIVAIRRWLERKGKDVHWLADRLTVQPEPLTPPAPHPWANQQPSKTTDWRVMLMTCLHYRESLTPREHEFIMSVLAQSKYRMPTDKQMGWLAAIHQRFAQFQN
jgi:hypothetical protein